MLDRYTIGSSVEELKKNFGVNVPDTFKTRYNAAPTQRLPVITNLLPDQVSMFHWGLMTPLSNGKPIASKLYNTKLDLVSTKPSLRNAVSKRKCVILCDGFYLWKKIAKKKQVPYYFYQPSREPFGVAGFWEENEDFENEEKSFAFNMITVPSVEKFLAFSNDHLPAILKKGREPNWLTGDHIDVSDFLDTGFHGQLLSHSVSPRIQDLKNDSIDLVRNEPPADQMGNYTLFG